MADCHATDFDERETDPVRTEVPVSLLDTEERTTGPRICRPMPTEDKKDKWRARLFINGRSQAVRLPKALRFHTEEVLMWRDGDRIILEPAPKATWPDGFWDALDSLKPFVD